MNDLVIETRELSKRYGERIVALDRLNMDVYRGEVWLPRVRVDLLGPYSEHLLRDIGGFYVGFGLLFVWAAPTLARELVRATCVAAILTSLLHFAYHAVHLEQFSAAETVACDGRRLGRARAFRKRRGLSLMFRTSWPPRVPTCAWTCRRRLR